MSSSITGINSQRPRVKEGGVQSRAPPGQSLIHEAACRLTHIPAWPLPQHYYHKLYHRAAPPEGSRERVRPPRDLAYNLSLRINAVT